MAASRANLIFPFLESIGAWFCIGGIVFNCGPARYWNEVDVFHGTGFLCLGLVLAISAVRRGLWSTEMMVVPAILILLLVLWSFVSLVVKARVLSDWDYVLDYWL